MGKMTACKGTYHNMLLRIPTHPLVNTIPQKTQNEYSSYLYHVAIYPRDPGIQNQIWWEPPPF